MASDRKFEINYIFRNDPRAAVIDAETETLPQHLAVHHLVHLHRAELEGELEEGERLPAADARPEDILHFATAHALTDIRVTKVRAHEKGDTPAFYKQP